jgi:hypothetical protein
MAGCFGNSDYDRYLEGQVNRYLQQGSDFEVYSESVINILYQRIKNDNFKSTYFDNFCDTPLFDEILEKNYKDGEETVNQIQDIANKLEIHFNEYIQAIIENGPQE